MSVASAVDPGLRSGATGAAEAAVRRDLAACYRLVSHFGWDDLVATHISARLPGSEQFLLNPMGVTFDEITASSLVKVGPDGEVVGDSPSRVNRAGFVIHSAVHMARPDVGCVIHLHSRDGVAVSALEDGVLPLNQHAIAISEEVAFHEYEGVACDPSERERLQRDLGPKSLMLLRNHGTLAAGRSVAAAFQHMYLLETVCTVQVRILGMGVAVHAVAPEVTAKVQQQAPFSSLASFAEELVWPALLRKLDRTNPGYEQ